MTFLTGQLVKSSHGRGGGSPAGWGEDEGREAAGPALALPRTGPPQSTTANVWIRKKNNPLRGSAARGQTAPQARGASALALPQRVGGSGAGPRVRGCATARLAFFLRKGQSPALKLQVALRAGKAVSNLAGDAVISSMFLPPPPPVDVQSPSATSSAKARESNNKIPHNYTKRQALAAICRRGILKL